MWVDGKKVACATCIKGHRASQCRHKDRPLIEIKKKGRPATQCQRCRELRLVRQLHVKCDCNDTKNTKHATSKTKSPSSSGIKKPCHSKLTTLRVIAPKPSSQEPMITKTCCQEQQQEQQEQQRQGEGEGEVCACAETGAKKCCSEDKVNEEGQKIRIVTCRCGDSCACPGCDAHPSRAMRGKQDPYAGYATSDLDPRRRLSIAAICDSSDAPTPKLVSEDRPTLVLAEDGTELCGCGCAMPYEACSNCLNELCRAHYDVAFPDV